MHKCFPQSCIVYRLYNIAIIQAPTHDLFCSSWGHDLIIFDSRIFYSLYFFYISLSLSFSLILYITVSLVGYFITHSHSIIFWNIQLHQTSVLTYKYTTNFYILAINQCEFQIAIVVMFIFNVLEQDLSFNIY